MNLIGNKKTETNFALGVKAEDCAVRYLETQRYTILKRRYKTKLGEIDIIAQKKNMICFIEVKTRTDKSSALESVTFRNQKRVENSALFFLSEYPEFSSFDMRFDVIAVTKDFEITHLDNAWEARS